MAGAHLDTLRDRGRVSGEAPGLHGDPGGGFERQGGSTSDLQELLVEGEGGRSDSECARSIMGDLENASGSP